MEQDNGYCILPFREQTQKMDRNVLNDSSELGKLVDTSLTCSPTPVIKLIPYIKAYGIPLPVKLVHPLLLEAIQPVKRNSITTVRLRVLVRPRRGP